MTDPSKHKSRKASNAEKRPEQTRIEEAGKSSKRNAPEAMERSKASSSIQKPSRKKLHVHGKTPQQTPEPNRLKEA